MLVIRVLYLQVVLLTSLFFIAPGVSACKCNEASLYGDQIDIYVHPGIKRRVSVQAAVELSGNGKMSGSAASDPFNIDIQPTAIHIDFNRNLGDLLDDGAVSSLRFEDINPRLPDSDCVTSIAGMYIQTNNSQATSLNAQSSFSDHSIQLVFANDATPGTINPSFQWTKQHWIKVNLTFSCAPLPPPPARNGMTWTYRGQSVPGGSARWVQVGCNGTADADAGKCNPYEGDTSCTAERAVLCVAKAGNIPRPAYTVNPGKENFTGWYPGALKLSPLTRGDQLTSPGVADDVCGEGWRMAEFHDGHWIKGMDAQHYHADSDPPWQLKDANTSGGWNFHGQFQGGESALHQLKTQRFWVRVKGQPANCWDE